MYSTQFTLTSFMIHNREKGRPLQLLLLLLPLLASAVTTVVPEPLVALALVAAVVAVVAVVAVAKHSLQSRQRSSGGGPSFASRRTKSWNTASRSCGGCEDGRRSTSTSTSA